MFLISTKVRPKKIEHLQSKGIISSEATFSRQIATDIYILNVFNSNGLGQFSFEMKNVEFHELSFFMYNVLFTASVCCVPSQTPIYRVVQTTPGH